MSTNYLKALKEYEPKVVTISKANREVLFEGERKGRFTLPDDGSVKDFRRVIEGLYQLSNVTHTDDKYQYHLDWTVQTPQFEEPIGDKYVGVPDKEELSQPPSLEESIAYLVEQINKHELFNVTITTNLVMIHDNVVTNGFTEKNYAKTLYSHYSQEHKSSLGRFEDTIEIEGEQYHMVFNSFGAENIVNFSRKIASDKPYSMGISGDMAERIRMMGNGLIGCSIHQNIGLDYTINMLTKVDPNVKKLSCVIGDVFKVHTEIPTTKSFNTKKSIIGSHYKYVFVDSKVEHTLGDLLDLVFNGKLVIIGYESDSLYGNLISLLNEGDSSTTETNKILTSTIGFVHPKISFSHGKISLEESESVTLNPTRVRTLFEGDISRERFNTYIDYPCKVYSLSLMEGTSTMATQKEEFDSLLTYAVSLGASDVQLAVNCPPKFRIQGELKEPYPNVKISPAIMKQLVSTIVTTEIGQKALLEEKQVGIAYAIYGLGRFRIQVITQRGTHAIFIRHTPHKIPDRNFLKVPDVVYDVVKGNPKGLVLVTGATSNGKSTTVASLLDELSNHDAYSITSISEPIEYLISHNKSIVTQRELPSDVKNYGEAIKAVFRMDPDIIEVTEMRDSESINALLRFANSGHLVLSTFHTDSVIATLDGLSNRLDPDRKEEMLSTFASSALVIMNQMLVPDINGKVFALFEYLIPTPVIRGYIADMQTSQIASAMKSSATSDKKTATWMDYELIEAYESGRITEETLHNYLREESSLQTYGKIKA